MLQILWDASGLSKRYYSESGTAAVNTLFSTAPSLLMAVTFIGYTETATILQRRRNQRDLSPTGFTQAHILLRDEILINPDFTLVSVSDTDFLAGVSLTERHNINASDAAILSAYLRHARSQPPNTPPCVLIASDRRLIRAAEAEGLRTLNPELVPAADIPAFIAHLS